MDDKDRFSAAEKLTLDQYDGPLYAPGLGSEERGDFFQNFDDLSFWCTTKDLALPPYVWACTVQSLSFHIPAKLIVAFSLQDQKLDLEVAPEEMDTLQQFLDWWCARQVSRRWDPDFSRAVLLQEDFDDSSSTSPSSQTASSENGR